MRFLDTLILTALAAVSIGASAQSVPKIYLNPSDQIHNWSRDKTYCEADGMQDVARKLEAKLKARGFDVRNSNGATMRESVEAANSWPADVFISLHSNAAGSQNSGKAHGTNTLYYYPRDGSAEPNPISIQLALLTDEKVVEKMTTYGRGHNFAVTQDFPFLPYNLYVLRRTEMPGTLVEGLFHDNEEDVAVLKTEEGRDAYAQGVYEALCDYFGWSYYPDAPILDPVGPVANDSEGNLALVVRGEKGNATIIRQRGVNARWDEHWMDLVGDIDGEPAISRTAQGRLQVFASGVHGRVLHKVQTRAGSDRWNGWYDLGGNAAVDPIVGRKADGRLTVFVIGQDGHLRYRTQRSVESAIQWDGWKDLGGSFGGKPAVSADPNGRLFVVAREGYLNSTILGDAGPGPWSKLGEEAVGDPVIIQGNFGHLQMYYLGPDGQVSRRSQWDSGWSHPEKLGGPFVSGPVAVNGTDKSYHLFAVDAQGAISHNFFDLTGGWSGWKSLGGTFIGSPMVGRNRDGRIEVFARGKDGKMMYRVQREPGKSAIWDGWYVVGEYFKATVREYKPAPEKSP